MGTRDQRLLTGDLLRDVWLLAVTILVLGISVLGYTANRHRINETNTLVHRIDRKAGQALIRTTLIREKVCSLSNQGAACRALFQRLAVNLSKAQRKRLACDVLGALTGPGVREIRKASRCPKPIRAP